MLSHCKSYTDCQTWPTGTALTAVCVCARAHVMMYLCACVRVTCVCVRVCVHASARSSVAVSVCVRSVRGVQYVHAYVARVSANSTCACTSSVYACVKPYPPVPNMTPRQADCTEAVGPRSVWNDVIQSWKRALKAMAQVSGQPRVTQPIAVTATLWGRGHVRLVFCPSMLLDKEDSRGYCCCCC